MPDNSNIDDILAALANYVVESIHLQPTPVEMIKLNQRQAKQAIQQELLKARKDELDNLLEWYDNLVPVDGRLLKRLDDRLDDLQAKIKGDSDERISKA